MLYTVVRNLYTAIKDGTQLDTFTSEASLMTGTTHPQPVIRASDLENATGKMYRLKASGIVGSTGTPTFTLYVRFNSATASIAGTVIAQSAAITTQNNASNATWVLECGMYVRTPGSSGTWALVDAETRSPLGWASPFAYGLWPGGSASDTWTVTYSTQSDIYVSVSAACGTSNASNLIKLKSLTLDEYR